MALKPECSRELSQYLGCQNSGNLLRQVLMTPQMGQLYCMSLSTAIIKILFHSIYTFHRLIAVEMFCGLCNHNRRSLGLSPYALLWAMHTSLEERVDCYNWVQGVAEVIAHPHALCRECVDVNVTKVLTSHNKAFKWPEYINWYQGYYAVD